MRKLALRDEILLQIDKAARYIGGEVNSVIKDKNDVDIRFAMCFPDVYEIGMSNLGCRILYGCLGNSWSTVRRAFCKYAVHRRYGRIHFPGTGPDQ